MGLDPDIGHPRHSNSVGRAAMTATTFDHLVTTRAVPASCPECQSVVLAGLAEGIPTTVDLTPLTRAGELRTVITGRDCYALRANELVGRDQFRLTSETPVVLPAHRCGAPVASELWATLPAAAALPADLEKAPF